MALSEGNSDRVGKLLLIAMRSSARLQQAHTIIPALLTRTFTALHHTPAYILIEGYPFLSFFSFLSFPFFLFLSFFFFEFPFGHVITLCSVVVLFACRRPKEARDLLEVWLACSPEIEELIQLQPAQYERVVELYALHILPALNEIDLALDFLKLNTALLPAKKTVAPPTPPQST